jgi:hypothetical protein
LAAIEKKIDHKLLCIGLAVSELIKSGSAGKRAMNVFDYAARRRTLRFVLLYSEANINLQPRTRRMLWGKQRKALVICDRNPSTAAAAAAERLT